MQEIVIHGDAVFINTDYLLERKTIIMEEFVKMYDKDADFFKGASIFSSALDMIVLGAMLDELTSSSNQGS